ncbi:chemotaxis protein CheA [Reinekea blandensis]|uniref:Chemotaxis protein CheA n=1 Tax=Reinekea blandensis MED297 TaxID=314283 RepID=A4BD11_9GAMM|nr:chemotaxis protein CheA [Reinekea blandensis]EAR10093.1 CheW-like protein [Reinekea sp. MED297] [Reinekea blandensis MED297]
MSEESVHHIFQTEAEELLVEMEDALLALEDDPTNQELVNSLFRAMHTIKGAAGVFNFNHITEFTHPVETEVDLIRQGQRTVDSNLIATLLKIKDHTWALVESAVDGDGSLSNALYETGEALLQELQGERSVAPAAKANTATSSVERAPESSTSNGHSRANPIEEMFAHDFHDDDEPPESDGRMDSDQWFISLDFQADALRNGLDPASFISYLSNLGDINDIVTLTHRVPSLEKADFESCYLGFRIAFVSQASKADIEAVFEFALDDCTVSILPPHSKVATYLKQIEDLPELESLRLGDILLSIGAVTKAELERALNLQSSDENGATEERKKIGELLVEQKVIEQPVIERALKKQQKSREQSQTIRVDSNKLGQLINLVGELVTSSAAMKIVVERYHMRDADEVVAGMEHLVEEIRDHALQLRMVQIGDTFSRFRRVTRDVSNELGKKIDLVISGGESELDKTVVEKINDPLTHLVRNALDHGIELPSERLAAGKPEAGTITLNAFHDSGHIVIEVIDDGRGLDPEKIQAKAEKVGLIEPGVTLSRAEIFRLVFEPGLSTKEQASNLSGRGVGMDVVRRNIEALRGSVELDSNVGKGTHITINLPLTLAIIDGFMVGAGHERYVIPLSMVEECVEFNNGDWYEEKGQSNFINLRGEVMPFVRLRTFFQVPQRQQRQHRESLVVVRMGRHKAGFVVDQLFGEQQTVIKPLGDIFQHLKGVSGATILGTGDIALILDVQGLLTLAGNQHAHHSQAVVGSEANEHTEG